MVPADSRRIPRVPRYSGYHYAWRRFAYAAVMLYGRPFQDVPLATRLATTWSYYPRARNARGLGCSPVARHYWGNHCCFLFLRVLRCFSSPRWPHDFLMMAASGPPGCPIRRSADQRPFAPPRGFSQLTTSFIASVSLGIHHAPLLSFSLSRGGSAPAKKGARDAALPSLCQHVKDLAPEKPACGEYRIRTDGLLHAMQAL